MAIRWQIPFRSLRANTLYTVNIYDANYSGTPMQLVGAATPFITEEEDNNDMFASIRTHSGYIRIVDQGGSFDWRTLVPTTDTDRPVTLTDGNGNVRWQGFMQAQNFGASLYVMPQDREFPVQCALATLSRLDANVSIDNGVKNFAWLLDYILNTIPTLTFTNIIVQGGADARIWLQKRFDWMVFGGTDTDGIFISKCDVMKALANMCRYWGWTARTQGQTLYLLSPDDADLVNFLVLTRAQLSELAAGNGSAGTISSGWSSQSITNQLASINNTDFQRRGPNSATLDADVGNINRDFIFCYPDEVNKLMNDLGFVPLVPGKLEFTADMTSFSTNLFEGHADNASNGSFNIMRTSNTGRPVTYAPVVRCKQAYSATTYAYLQTKKQHAFTDGEIILSGRAYHGGWEVDAKRNPFPFGTKHMMMQLGIGITRESAQWWNGAAWVNARTSFYVKIGGSSDVLYTCTSKTEQSSDNVYGSIPTPNMYGYLFIHFMGADETMNDDVSLVDPYSVDVADFNVEYVRPDDIWRFIEPKRFETREYTAKNEAVVKEEWSDGSIFATDNYCQYGPGLVMNNDNTYFQGWDYTHHMAGATRPEQHMVDRVASFWNKSRRVIEGEIRYDLISSITPRHKVTIDGTTLYPIAICNDWRDDVTRIITIEL